MPKRLTNEQIELSRRLFLGLGATGLGGQAPLLASAEPSDTVALAEATAKLRYLSPVEKFRFAGRGNPPPDKLSPERRREVGLHPDTWRLEVVPDPESDCKLKRPFSKELGTALDWAGLMRLAEKCAVRYLKVMSCTNVGEPLGMGLWEGVPLKELIWLTRPTANLRRIYYYGYDNNDPKQRFQSSLAIGRVLEDPPGDLPVILCYKLNGQWLTPEAGGPVRLVVPDAYGNKSIKWLQRIVLTNNFQANDSYALQNNDVESPLKTHARFIHVPDKIRLGEPTAITGLAQVGMSGLSRVQYWLAPQDAPLPEGDPYFTTAPWKDALILPPPTDWGGGLTDGKLPPIPLQIDPPTSKPREWPLRNTIVHWAALLRYVPAGHYDVRCRTIDLSGVAQPMPRPFPRSGNNFIQQMPMVVEG